MIFLSILQKDGRYALLFLMSVSDWQSDKFIFLRKIIHFSEKETQPFEKR